MLNQAQVDVYNNRLRMVTDQSQDTFEVGKNLRLALDSLDKSYLRYSVHLSLIRRLYSNRPRLEYLPISICFKRESEWVTV